MFSYLWVGFICKSGQLTKSVFCQENPKSNGNKWNYLKDEKVDLKELASLSNGLEIFFCPSFILHYLDYFLSIWYDCNSKDIRNCCIFGKWLSKNFFLFFILYISIMWTTLYLSTTKTSWCRFPPCLTCTCSVIRIFPFIFKGEGRRDSYISTNQETGVLWTQLSWRQCLKSRWT